MSASVPHLELREVRGPSALGGGLRRFWDLTWLIAVNYFRVTYLGTALGYIWTLIRPLFLFGVLLFVFTQIIRIGDQVDNYPVVLLFGIMLFTFFQESTQNAVPAVVQEESVVRKTQFPRLAIPLASVLSGVFNLGLNLVVVFAFILIYGVGPYWTWLLLPLLLLPLIVLTSALASMLSALYVRFRDISIIWTVSAQTLFYATPVLYTIDIVPSRFRWLILLNPLTPIFLQAQKWIINPSGQGAAAAAGAGWKLLPPLTIFIAVCLLSIWVFNREAPRMAEEL